MVLRVNRRLLARWCVYPAIILGLVAVLMVTVRDTRSQHEPDNLQLVMPAPRRVPNPSVKSITRWIHALGSNQKTVRKNARHQLLAAGDAALPALQRCLEKLTTPPLRRSLRSVAKSIAQADFLRGPLVTVQLNHATLLEVIKHLCLPVGIHPEFYPLFSSGVPIPACFEQETLSINVRREPFWAVIRQLAKITGIGPGPGFFDQFLHFGGSRFGLFQNSASVDSCGPFVFVLRRPNDIGTGRHAFKGPTFPVTGARSIKPAVMRSRRLLHLDLDLLWCPDGAQLDRIGGLKHLQIMDRSGRSLALNKHTYSQQFNPWNQSREVEFSYNLFLKRPPAGVKAIAAIRGNVPIIVSFNPLIRQAKHLTSGTASMHIGAVRVRFGKPVKIPADRSNRSNSAWGVTLKITSDRMDQAHAKLLVEFLQSLRNNGSNGNQTLQFRAAKEKHWRTPVLSSNSGLAVDYSYRFEISGPEPACARINVFRQRSVKMDIPFEFENVALPRQR